MRLLRRRAWVLAAVLLLSRVPAAALDPRKPLSYYNLDVYTDVLPQNTVLALLQTRDGRLWLGTYEGLVSFDGVDFETFDERRIPGMRNRRVRALAEDRNGTLWIGTLGSGLVRHRAGTFSTFSSTDGLPSDFVQALSAASDGSLWVGTTAGLGRLKDGRFTTYRRKDGLSNEAIQALVEGLDGTLYVGTEAGLETFRDGRFTPVSLGVAKAPQIASLAVGRDGTLYVGTIGAGLFVLKGASIVHYEPGAGFPAPFVPAILKDRHETVWVATYPGGLARLVNGKFETLGTKQGLPSSSIRSLWEDREGSLWVGTNGGLARLKDLKFVNLATRQGLSESNVRVVTEAKAGGIWVGTYGGGVNRVFPDGTVKVYGEKEGLSDLYVRTMLEDRDGALWVGTTGGGLDRIRGDHVDVFKEKDGLSGSNVNGLLEKRDGSLLAVTQEGGLDLLVGKRFVPLLSYDRRDLGSVRCLLEDAKGTLWLGTYDRGLLEVHGDRVTKVWKDRDGVPQNVFALREDPDGTLWIGTHAGLRRLRPGETRATTVGARAGLPDDVVFQILDDGRGAFWLTSNRGLARVERKDLDAVLDGRAVRVSAAFFGKADGMGSSQCNGATQPAGVKLSDGRLALPTAGGVTLVDPADLHVNAVPPPVDVTRVLVNGHAVDLAANPNVSWRSERFEIRYAGLSLLQPERVTFRYRMDVLDADWIEAGTRRSAFYNSLPPGRHVFHVQARNNDGFLGAEEARLEFNLPAAPWRRWWALLLYALAFGGVLAAAIRVRERALVHRSQRLEQRVRDRTAELAQALERVAASEAKALEASGAKSAFLASMSHELRTPLNAILGFTDLLSRDESLGDEQRSYVSTINESGEHLLGLINDVLSLSQIEAGQVTVRATTFDLRRLARTLGDMIRVRATAKGLELAVEVSPAVPALVSGDDRKLRQILLNLLGNAVKFTEKGRVTLHVDWKEGLGLFDVTDTGPGIAAAEIDRLFNPFVQSETGRKAAEGTGLGLAISRRFARLLGGDLTVKSEVGKGSTFKFDLPLPRVELETKAETKAEKKTEANEEPKPAPATIDAAPSGETRRPSRSRRFAEGQEVLVAEDHPINRELAREILRRAGLNVTAVADGNEALDQIGKKRFDVVLMDVEMPEKDGIEAVTELRRDARFRDLPVIAMTAHAMSGDKERFLDAGMTDYVPKPIEAEVLFGVLERWLRVLEGSKVES